MTWTRLSDGFHSRPDILALSRDARLLHIEALGWSNEQLTDGYIPAAVLRKITDAENPEPLITELVEHGLWSDAPDGGWFVEWTDQETAERVKARRAERAEIQRRYRERGEMHAKGDHRQCTSRCPKQGQVTGNATRLVTTSVTASRPVPSRPLGRDGEGTRAGAPSAGAPGGPREQIEMPAEVTFHVVRPPKTKRSA